jgi:2-oxoglutarate dehydrogenase E2 component (dihydrolipoamide succinyltransferase)
MADFELVMPKMGESIAEATIIRWTKNEGDAIAADETVLEIATDKVDSEVPSPKGGVLKKILYKENDVVAVGAVIAIIAMEGSAAAPSAPAPKAEAAPEVKAAAVQVEKTVTTASQTVSNAGGARFYSPLVLNIAKEENISMSELENIPGTGNEGRVTKKDILAYVQNRGAAPAVSAPAATSVVEGKRNQTACTIGSGCYTPGS